MTSPEDSQEPGRQLGDIIRLLERLATEYAAFPVRDPRSADEIVGYDAAGLPG